MTGGLWSVATIGGPILLAAVILFALFRNRQKETPAEIDKTERATKQLYEQEDVAQQARENDVQR